MFFVLRILVVSFFFWILFPSWERIYFYHFGEVTNSDALYPFLFAGDFWTAPSYVTGWSFPPSHYFFPDVLFFILGYPLSSEVFTLYSFYAGFCFVFVYYFFRQMKIPNYASLAGSVFLLKLGEISPVSWGQFYLPGFHSAEIFLVLCFFILFKRKDKARFSFVFPFILLTSVSLLSESWFAVHSGLPLLILFLADKNGQKSKTILFVIVSIILYKVAVFYLGHLGFRSYSPNEFPIKKLLLETWASFKINPSSYLSSVFIENAKLPVSKFLFPAYWIFVLFFLFSWKKFQKQIQDKETYHSTLLYLYLILSPFCGLLFLSLTGIEFNARYLFILPISCFGLFCYFLKKRRILLRVFLSTFLAFTLVGSNRFAPDPKLEEQILSGKTKQSHRIECTVQTWRKWGKPIGAADYWPVKYLKVMSKESIHLIPLTESGEYYPWIHNRNWDKGIADLGDTNSFDWAITEGEKKEIWNRKGVEFESCENWQLIRFDLSQ
ncbi:hypothetical protein LPTSP3_g32930 [Leptospira kobayashii]|uniref:Membrane protein, PF09852 family n=1 Tax=Leptospira kobayashii TaxID=1917830 RepID=A0ABN6KGM5_9LEPT|nr:hypothetical protein [Leptospira kobayashii]BDA80363.1 hypothetical protein LPTSP3_g32930 [Leptospira kobayashii]